MIPVIAFLVSKEEERNIIQAGTLLMNLDAHSVSVEGEQRIFTAKEFDLFTFLARHPNKVFSKEHLFERIWGFDSMGDISTVTVHVRKIREKIEKDPSNPKYIETVWGAGYRFIP